MLFKTLGSVRDWYIKGKEDGTDLLDKLEEDIRKFTHVLRDGSLVSTLTQKGTINVFKGCKIQVKSSSNININCISHKFRLTQLQDRTLDFIRNLKFNGVVLKDDDGNALRNKFKNCQQKAPEGGSTGVDDIDTSLNDFCKYRGIYSVKQDKSERYRIELSQIVNPDGNGNQYIQYQCK